MSPGQEEGNRWLYIHTLGDGARAMYHYHAVARMRRVAGKGSRAEAMDWTYAGVICQESNRAAGPFDARRSDVGPKERRQFVPESQGSATATRP